MVALSPSSPALEPTNCPTPNVTSLPNEGFAPGTDDLAGYRTHDHALGEVDQLSPGLLERTSGARREAALLGW